MICLSGLQEASFVGEGEKRVLKFTKYLDSFPFPYYIVLKNIEALPRTLADLLRQVSLFYNFFFFFFGEQLFYRSTGIFNHADFYLFLYGGSGLSSCSIQGSESFPSDRLCIAIYIYSSGERNISRKI
jgi:hypothetical protein